MRKRLIALVIATVLAASALLSVFSQPAQAKNIPAIIGCDSLLEWPCPGPVIL